jgi:hypothetical protein
MAALGISVRHYKVYAAWIGEKVGRLKFNGHLTSRSPLSGLEELEMLRLGVEGKAAGWRTLRTLAGKIPGWTPVSWTASSQSMQPVAAVTLDGAGAFAAVL